MYERKLFSELEAHLNERFITVLTGMRRVGKSTALKYLLSKVEHENKIYLDLERVENRYIFQQMTYKDVQIDLEIQGVDFSRPSVIALDEIQLVPEITSIIKYFYDTWPVKFLVTGSSSFYLKNHFSESLAGRKHIFEMFPLDFSEFVRFKREDDAMLERMAMQPYRQSFYIKYKDLYEEYLRYGGFPEVVLTSKAKSKVDTLKDIINAYIDLDVRLLSDFSASKDLYVLMRLLAARVGTLIDVSKISGALGVNRNKVEGYLELLEKTYFIHMVTPYSTSVDRELSRRRKLYFADVGMLQQLGQVSSGQVFENQVFLQLAKKGVVNYYQKKSGQEIDFILDQKHAFEVKETPHTADLKVLGNRAHALKLDSSTLIGRFPPGDAFADFTWGGSIV